MGFSANTRILTAEGFKAIQDLALGDVLPTPAGDTEVLYLQQVVPLSPMAVVRMSPFCSVVQDQVFVAFAGAGNVPPSRGFGFVYSEREAHTIRLTGGQAPIAEPCLRASEICRLGKAISHIPEFEDVGTGADTYWLLGTQNRVAVADVFVTFLTPHGHPTATFYNNPPNIGPLDWELFNRRFATLEELG